MTEELQPKHLPKLAFICLDRFLKEPKERSNTKSNATINSALDSAGLDYLITLRDLADTFFGQPKRGHTRCPTKKVAQTHESSQLRCRRGR